MYADKDNRIQTHGGLVCYIKNELAVHVFDVSFITCYISLRLDFAPSLVIIGTYIQPENSKYFDANMFSDISTLLLSIRERKLIPIMGGDINCRYGDMTLLFHEEGLLYEHNVDSVSNMHGRIYGKDMCHVGEIFPLNHLCYKGKSFEGDFTYHKAGTKSQIDLAYTNKEGLKLVKSFKIHNDNWHFSDHKPIEMKISISNVINCTHLLKKAKELNYEFNPHLTRIVRHTGSYDLVLLHEHLARNEIAVTSEILEEINNCNVDGAIGKIDQYLHEAHRRSKVKQTRDDKKTSVCMEKANKEYENYKKCLAGETDETPETAFAKYQKTRNGITSDMYISESKRWKSLTNNDNPKELWNSIYWKGDISKCNTKQATVEELASHFEELYSSKDPDEASKINDLATDVYIPILDDPITQDDISIATKEMKKGGYDYHKNVLLMLVQIMSPILLLLFNIMFYVEYPVRLEKSLLIAIPKKGNLSLAVNYRGIQMLAALGALFDRIIANRLQKWAGVNYEQSAFQKGKSTIHQLFTIRLITEITKRANKTLYIGFFDLEKAFDKISRYILLKKLIKLGIGSCMLQALKRLYSLTFCILSYHAETSDEFRTSSGIRQGAPSSVFLFILFVDDLISYLKTNCIEEPIIGLMHCLLHADDTAILSTNRNLFVEKCNLMLKYFHENSLSLNFSKSSYFIINGKGVDHKSNIKLNIGTLEYKSRVTYLGAIFSDTGSIKYDISQYVEGKRSNITIKYNNFLNKNYMAPLMVKLKVLDSCVSSTLVYGCEAWGISSIPNIEVIYRMGIKRALSVREGTINEIVYLEAEKYPLMIRIAKQQLNFWKKMNLQLQQDVDNPISNLIKQGEDIDLQYLRHYKMLEEKYDSPFTCQRMLNAEFDTEIRSKIRAKAGTDGNSRFGAYLIVNPQLIAPPQIETILENERIGISRYRCGSHNLKIEVGRMCNPKMPREERLCRCNMGLQTLQHCLLDCPLLLHLYEVYTFTSVEEGLNSSNISIFFSKMESILKISKYS